MSANAIYSQAKVIVKVIGGMRNAADICAVQIVP
jgi:hypothetical protein